MKTEYREIEAAGGQRFGEMGREIAMMDDEEIVILLRVFTAQLWLGHPEMRAAIEDKLAHVMNAAKHEAASLSPDGPRKEQMPDVAVHAGLAGMGPFPIM